VNIEKRHDVAVAEDIPVNVPQFSPVLGDYADRDVTWDERIRNSGKSAVSQMHVGSTHFSVKRVEQSGARLELGRRVFLGARCAADAPNRRGAI
jgi:hypothetical protein